MGLSDVNWISFESCAFVGPVHECTASVVPRIRVLGCDNIEVGEEGHIGREPERKEMRNKSEVVEVRKRVWYGIYIGWELFWSI
ncbi:hypothetical protein SLEP1_g9802 [Rubroshorea leprosula]|uniref:Uncharacterized protein n=1 Tax=Rubroshorea leprosula TaxID=152421 RepID=A0AAV5I617_9ROSI|nr:hypothetical protein SLEP1_g9802 [Rubroshorea leprosula]